jgi:tRNA splicing endonuclease
MVRGRGGGGGGGGGMPYFMPNPYVQLPPSLVKQMEEAFAAQKYLTATKTEVAKGKVVNRVTEAETTHMESLTDISQEKAKQEASKTSRSTLDTVNKALDTGGKVVKAGLKVGAMVAAYKAGAFLHQAYNDPFQTMYDAASSSRSAHMDMAAGATAGFAGVPKEWVTAKLQVPGTKLGEFYPTAHIQPGEGLGPIGPWPKPKHSYSKTQGFQTTWDFRDTPEDMINNAQKSFWYG